MTKSFHNKSLTPSKTLKFSRVSYSAPITPKSSDKKTNEKITFLQNKIKVSQDLLMNARNDITKLEIQIEELRLKHKQLENPQPITRKTDEYNPQQNNCTKKKIMIVGTQQCTGLAAELIKSRMDTRYEDYQVSAFIKPFAAAGEVLELCKNLEVDVHDRVIICVGENDEDPISTIAELYSVFKLQQHTTVIVLSVLKIKHINNKLLNSQLKYICNKFMQSYFVEIRNHYTNYLKNICYSVNLLIDSMYYDKTFLYFPFAKNHTRRNGDCGANFLDRSQIKLTNRKSTYRQTSILDFFYSTPQSEFFRSTQEQHSNIIPSTRKQCQ